jgi:hypothetical protein
MQQLHRRFTDEQVKLLLKGYRQGVLARAGIQEMLGVGKTQFFALLKGCCLYKWLIIPAACQGG